MLYKYAASFSPSLYRVCSNIKEFLRFQPILNIYLSHNYRSFLRSLNQSLSYWARIDYCLFKRKYIAISPAAWKNPSIKRLVSNIRLAFELPNCRPIVDLPVHLIGPSFISYSHFIALVSQRINHNCFPFSPLFITSHFILISNSRWLSCLFLYPISPYIICPFFNSSGPRFP